jgi:hypothetical protein
LSPPTAPAGIAKFAILADATVADARPDITNVAFFAKPLGEGPDRGSTP